MSLVNKAHIRKFALEYAERTRHKKFTQVSASVYDAVEAKIRDYLRALVDSQPSKGQTIRA